MRTRLTAPYEGPYDVIRRCRKYYVVKINEKNESNSVDRLKPAFESEENPDIVKSPTSLPVFSFQRRKEKNSPFQMIQLSTFFLRLTVHRIRDWITGGGSCSDRSDICASGTGTLHSLSIIPNRINQEIGLAR